MPLSHADRILCIKRALSSVRGRAISDEEAEAVLAERIASGVEDREDQLSAAFHAGKPLDFIRLACEMGFVEGRCTYQQVLDEFERQTAH